jgi:hypothetical protein
MELTNSLLAFFYNIIPGFIFVLVNSKIFEFYTSSLFDPNDSTIGTIQILVLSIFLGFVFQSFTKIYRDACFNNLIIKEIDNKDKQLLNKAKDKLKKISSLGNENTLQIIYSMHNYLVAKYKYLLPEFFSPRLALWSNMFFASLITIFLILIAPFFYIYPISFFNFIPIDIILLSIFAWHSWNMSKKYLFALFDSIIRTFVITETLE